MMNQPNYYYQPSQPPMGVRYPGTFDYTQNILPQAPPAQLKGRPVSSIDEVRAAQIDFDGSIFIFPDIANKKIYTKHINVDGSLSLNAYSLVEELPSIPTYVTKEEFERTISELKSQYSQTSPTIPITSTREEIKF